MKGISTIGLLLLCLVAVIGQPLNDECGSAVDLGEAPTCPTNLIFTNVDATASTIAGQNIPSCFMGGSVINRDVWFVFQTPANVPVSDQNYLISIFGVAGTPGIQNPQLALYRGVCPDGLAEWDCASAVSGSDEVVLEVEGLIPGIPYYIRVNDFSATAAPNWGEFRICVDNFAPFFNMGDESQSSLCNGVVYDSGGPDVNYINGENHTFTICPTDFHNCININVEEYNIESGYDYLRVYGGSSASGIPLAEISGTGTNFEVEVPTECVTLQFFSDATMNESGFELSWSCSPDSCTTPSVISCDNPVVIQSLPYSQNNLSTCNAGNTIFTSPCNSLFITGMEYIFAYESAGDECVNLELSGTSPTTGVAIYNDCPNVADECLGIATVSLFESEASISNVYLGDPGTYYIAVANPFDCTSFGISIEAVECLDVLPSAALCEDALPLLGCDPDIPTSVTVVQNEGDPNFIQNGVNNGCWDDIILPNYTWFYFQAQESGDFGFLLSSASPGEVSDIDIQVWGPIIDFGLMCDIAETHQPVRSTYADDTGLYDLTGLVNTNPITNSVVRDDCEDAFGDGFVRALPVIQGRYYLVLINDFSGLIYSGAINIDFSPTSPGVLGSPLESFSVTRDTVICPGESVQLKAEGGLSYRWLQASGLSCRNCADPIASPTESTTYSVSIAGVCQRDTLSVIVEIPTLSAGADIEICQGQPSRLQAQSNFSIATFVWSGPSGTLSCTDCQNPHLNLIDTGDYEFIVNADFGNCQASDTVIVTVIDGNVEYEIAPNSEVCVGDTINLGGPSQAGYTYSWISNPMGYSSQESNPVLVADASSTFYLSIISPECPAPIFDSVVVEVFEPPVLPSLKDTLICNGEMVTLNPNANPGLTYFWQSGDGTFVSDEPSPLVAPGLTTKYLVSVESNPACPELEGSLTIEIIPQATLNILPDSILICDGEEVQISAESNLIGGSFEWNTGEQANEIFVSPSESTTFEVIYISPMNCDTILGSSIVTVGDLFSIQNIEVESETEDIYEGDDVTLHAILDPVDLQNLNYEWSENGDLLSQNEVSIIVSPLEDGLVNYQLIVTNEDGCDQFFEISLEVKESDIVFPNIFTPDNDNLNDFFNAIKFGNAWELEELKIFNRWGEMVYDNEHPDIGWDGTIDGEPQSSDVYVFYANSRNVKTGETRQVRGDITLIR